MIIYNANLNKNSIDNIYQFNNKSTLRERGGQPLTYDKQSLTIENQQFLKSIGLKLKKYLKNGESIS